MGEVLKNAGALKVDGFKIYSTDGQLVRKIPLTLKTEYGADRMIYYRMDLHDALRRFATREQGQGQPVAIRTSS